MPDEACYADDIGDYRWEGIPLAEKHAWMQTGEGAAAVQPAVNALKELSERLAQSDRTLRAELRELGVTWSGTASDAASSATDRLAEWVGGVGRTTAAGQGNVDTYGSSFAEMKPKIPPPVQVEKGSFGHLVDAASGGYAALVGLQTDYSRQVEAQRAADQQANAALDAHREATRHALRTFPVAEAPPEPTVRTGPTSGLTSGSATAVGSGATSPGSASGPAGHGPTMPADAATTPRPGTAHDPVAGTSSAAAGDRPASSPDVRQPPPAAAPAGPIPVGPVGVGRSGPAPTGSPASRGYRPPTIRPAAAGSTGPAYRPGAGAGTATHRDAGLPPRTGDPGGASAERVAQRAGPGSGVHGAPLGLGGGSGGAERHHRNQTFIPSDEPFHVEFSDLSPPVLDLGTEDEP